MNVTVQWKDRTEWVLSGMLLADRVSNSSHAKWSGSRTLTFVVGSCGLLWCGVVAVIAFAI